MYRPDTQYLPIREPRPRVSLPRESWPDAGPMNAPIPGAFVVIDAHSLSLVRRILQRTGDAPLARAYVPFCQRRDG